MLCQSCAWWRWINTESLQQCSSSCAKVDPCSHFSTLHKPNSRWSRWSHYLVWLTVPWRDTSLHLLLYKFPSLYPDLGRWRCTRRPSLRWGASRPFCCSWTPNQDQAWWQPSVGWRCEAAGGPLTDLETTLSTHHTRESQWPVVPRAARGQLGSGPQRSQCPELSRMEPCPASGENQTRRSHPECPWSSPDASRRFDKTSKFNLTLSVVYFFSFYRHFHFYSSGPKPDDIKASHSYCYVSLVPDEGE